MKLNCKCIVPTSPVCQQACELPFRVTTVLAFPAIHQAQTCPPFPSPKYFNCAISQGWVHVKMILLVFKYIDLIFPPLLILELHSSPPMNQSPQVVSPRCDCIMPLVQHRTGALTSFSSQDSSSCVSISIIEKKQAWYFLIVTIKSAVIYSYQVCN